MKIGVDARPLSLQLTGVGNVISSLVSGLLDRGHEMVLFSDAPLLTHTKGATELVVPSQDLKQWISLLPQACRQAQIEVYHATWNYGVPWSSPMPVVLTVHDVIPARLPWRYFLGAKIAGAPRYYFWQIQSLARASAIATDSDSTGSDIGWLYPMSAGKTTTIYPGFSAPEVTWKGDSVLEKFAVTKPYIVYVGGIDPRKNVKTLIRAFGVSSLKSSHQLVITGKGAEYLRPFANQQGVADGVIFTDYVTEAEKFAFLEKAACLVYPSLYEGFGYPPLEAMAVGTPVICSKGSSFPEIVGDAGILVDPHNSQHIASEMGRLVGDAALQKRLTELGYAQIKQFSWTKAVEEYELLYQKVLAADHKKHGR